ncbi:hypothetical protein FACS189472_12960 [Alphaproteobacteria bacterium]|nr:hypothetical protein FACS189472_12960 [Alphaproteobacteria bacterium]
MVASDTTDKLLPNMAPPTTVPIANGAGSPCAIELNSAAIGPIAAIVPIAPPIDVERKAVMRNIPINKKLGDKNEVPKLIKELTPPMLFVTSPKAPAKRKIVHMFTISLWPTPAKKSDIFSLEVLGLIIHANIMAGIMAVSGESNENALGLPEKEKYAPLPTKMQTNIRIGAKGSSTFINHP